jgi:hypothetical protein
MYTSEVLAIRLTLITVKELKISNVVEEFCLLEYNTKKPARPGSKHCFLLVSCLTNSLALKMEATFSSGTLVQFQQTTWRYILENRRNSS